MVASAGRNGEAMCPCPVRACVRSALFRAGVTPARGPGRPVWVPSRSCSPTPAHLLRVPSPNSVSFPFPLLSVQGRLCYPPPLPFSADPVSSDFPELIIRSGSPRVPPTARGSGRNAASRSERENDERQGRGDVSASGVRTSTRPAALCASGAGVRCSLLHVTR